MEFDYAWGWFQYHASQRLTAFNFFLIIVGFLLVGFAQAIGNHWGAFGTGLGLLGAWVSAGFLALDVRNAELVIYGKDALAGLESGMQVSQHDAKRDRTALPEALGFGSAGSAAAPFLRWFFKHELWLRAIIAVVGLSFLACAGWALCGYPGIGQSEATSCRASTVLVLHRHGLDLSLVQRSEQEREQGGADHDRGRPGDGLSGDLHVESVGVGDHQRVEAGRHCGKQPVSSG
jgi:hypothetical protein